MQTDIQQRSDVELLVTAFYDKVKTDDCIGYIFNDVAAVDWTKHLPVMFDFWENVLFYTGTYRGNPMQAHQQLHRTCPLTAAHFERWSQLFNATVDELFTGPGAELAKQRAASIATVMQLKILPPTSETFS